MKVTLSPKAREYVKREASYLRSHSLRAAQQFLDDLKRLKGTLGNFPEMGKPNDEMPVTGVRRFVVGSYLVDYAVTHEEVLVFAIRHGRERPPSIELDDDFDLEDPD